MPCSQLLLLLTSRGGSLAALLNPDQTCIAVPVSYAGEDSVVACVWWPLISRLHSEIVDINTNSPISMTSTHRNSTCPMEIQNTLSTYVLTDLSIQTIKATMRR